MNKKVQVATLSVASNTMLITLKIIAGVMSGSVSIISEAIHSGMDLVASLIALFSVKVSSKPADKGHPYGHGKIENVSGVVEGLLIFIAAFLIIKEAILKISHPTPIEAPYVAMAVMIISGLVNTIVAKQIYKVAKAENSVALEADALHLKTDVYTSLGVGLGILIIKLTGINILDPIVAILVALLIIKEAWHLCYKAFGPLIDTKLPDDEEEKILKIINPYVASEKIINYHHFRAIQTGIEKHIDFHIVVDKNSTVRDAHDLSDLIEKEIEDNIKNASINIHIEPSS